MSSNSSSVNAGVETGNDSRSIGACEPHHVHLRTGIATGVPDRVECHHRRVADVGVAEHRGEDCADHRHLHIRGRARGRLVGGELAVCERHRDRVAEVDAEPGQHAGADRDLVGRGGEPPLHDDRRCGAGRVDREYSIGQPVERGAAERRLRLRSDVGVGAEALSCVGKQREVGVADRRVHAHPWRAGTSYRRLTPPTHMPTAPTATNATTPPITPCAVMSEWRPCGFSKARCAPNETSVGAPVRRSIRGMVATRWVCSAIVPRPCRNEARACDQHQRGHGAEQQHSNVDRDPWVQFELTTGSNRESV